MSPILALATRFARYLFDLICREASRVLVASGTVFAMKGVVTDSVNGSSTAIIVLPADAASNVQVRYVETLRSMQATSILCGACLGIAVAAALAFKLHLRPRHGFLPGVDAPKVLRWAHTSLLTLSFAMVAVLAVVAWNWGGLTQIMVTSRPDSHWFGLNLGLIFLLGLVASWSFYIGTIFTLAPRSVAVLTAPPGLRAPFRSLRNLGLRRSGS